MVANSLAKHPTIAANLSELNKRQRALKTKNRLLKTAVQPQRRAKHRRRHAGVVFPPMTARDSADRARRATVVTTVGEGCARQQKVGAGQVHGARCKRAVPPNLRRHRQCNRIVAPRAAVFQPARRVGALSHARCAAGRAFVLSVQGDFGDVEGVESGHSLQHRLVVASIARPAPIGPHRIGGRARVRISQLRRQRLQQPFGRLSKAGVRRSPATGAGMY